MTDTARTPAHAYQDYYGPAIFEPLRRHVTELAAPAPGERVLDVACGTGIVARAVADLVGPAGHVVGVDVNPVMLDVARSLSVAGGTTAPVEWHQGDATALDLPDASFHLVCCQQGLQFFPDRAAAAAEMRRVLVTQGRAVVAVWRGIDVHPLFAALADAEEPHLSALGAPVGRAELIAPFSLGDGEDVRGLLSDAGFRRIEIVPRSIEARFADADNFVERMEYAYAAVIPQFAADPTAFQAFLDAVTRDTRHIVASHRDGDEVVVPMHANIAVAYA